MNLVVTSQNSGPTVSPSPLIPRLRALAGEVRSDPSRKPALSALLQRIDETVLPRILFLSTDQGARLRLLVSNRRLMRVETEGENAFAGDAAANPAEAAARFAERLGPVLEAAASLSIESARYHADALFWDSGCDAGRLAAALNGEGEDAPGHGNPDALKDLLVSTALAWAEVSRTGEVIAQEPPGANPPVLSALLDRVAEMADADARSLTDRQAQLCFLPVSADRDAMVMRHQKGYRIAITPASIRDRLVAVWQHDRRPD